MSFNDADVRMIACGKMCLMYIESVAFICLPLRLMTKCSVTRDFELLDSAEFFCFFFLCPGVYKCVEEVKKPHYVEIL